MIGYPGKPDRYRYGRRPSPEDLEAARALLSRSPTATEDEMSKTGGELFSVGAGPARPPLPPEAGADRGMPPAAADLVDSQDWLIAAMEREAEAMRRQTRLIAEREAEAEAGRRQDRIDEAAAPFGPDHEGDVAPIAGPPPAADAPADRRTSGFGTGARRSAEGDHLEFTSLPLLGLLGVARTAAEGRDKYGRYNYLRGIPAHKCVDRAIRHLVLWSLGDRAEPHLEHAAWNCLQASQAAILRPDLDAEHMPGPGMAVAPMAARLEREAVELAARRAAGDLDGAGAWTLADLPEVGRILAARAAAPPADGPAGA